MNKHHGPRELQDGAELPGFALFIVILSIIGLFCGLIQPKMTKNNQILLIMDVIYHARRAKSLGMTAGYYNRMLREAIYYIWEKKPGKNKYKCSEFRSHKARNVPDNSKNLVYDHILPISVVIQQLMDLVEVCPDTVGDILDQVVTCTITLEEDQDLRSNGLLSSMPEGYKPGDSPLCRYAAAGISVYIQG